MPLTYILMVFFYWICLTGAVFIAGAYTSKILVTGPSGAEVCLPAGKKKCLGEEACQTLLWVSLLTFLANAAHAVFHASVMTDTPLNEVFSIISLFLTKTKYGKFTMARIALVAFVAVISFVCTRRSSKSVDVFGAVVSLSLLVAFSMSGHKGAKGYFNFPFTTDVLHIVSVSLWIGGVFFIFMCYSFLIRKSGDRLWETLKVMMNRFSSLATFCVCIAIITGIVLSFFSVRDLDDLIGTPYGLVLIAKVLLAGIIMAMGAANKFYVVPRINSADISDQEDMNYIRGRLSAFVAVETYVGIGVLLATAVLTHLSPEG